MVRFAAVTFDLSAIVPAIVSVAKDWLAPIVIAWLVPVKVTEEPVDVKVVTDDESHDPAMAIEARSKTRRSEERRVGKECRSRWSQDDGKEKRRVRTQQR